MSGQMALWFKKNEYMILPYVLVCVLMSAIFSAYKVKPYSIWNILACVMTFFLFLLCKYVEKHKVIGGCVVTMVSIFTIMSYTRLTMGSDWGRSFRQWFLSGADDADTKTRYLLAVLIGFTVFFSFTVYYFSKVLYRISFLTLISLIPCVLYIKVVAEINNIYVVLISLINILILMMHQKNKMSTKALTIGYGTTAISMLFFAFILMLATAAIPKERKARYYDEFENMFMGGNTTETLGENYSSLNEFSGNADAFRGFSNRTMYLLYGESLPYFKKHTFDFYDFDNDRWYKGDYSRNPEYTMFDWRSNHMYGLSSFQSILVAANSYSPGFASKYGMERLANAQLIEDEARVANIQAENFEAEYYLAPVRTIGVSIDGAIDENIRITKSGAFISTDGLHKNDVKYKVTYYDEFDSRGRFLSLGGANVDDDKSLQMLTEMKDIFANKNDILVEVTNQFIDAQNEANQYRIICEPNNKLISPEIKALASKITANCEYDWERAYAIQNYFLSGEFKYDLQYIAKDNSPEYFLFTSKTGSCSDYAAAFVLLGRAAGLTVRYAEGYAPEKSNTYEGLYEIRDRDSHAYPEVFIQNMGWMVFEPTAPSYYSDKDNDVAIGQFEFPQIEMDYGLMFVVFAFAVGISLIVLLVAVILPLVSESVFLARLKGATSEEAVVLAYKRIVSKCDRGHVNYARAMTPREFAAHFLEIMLCDISQLTYLVEKVYYAGQKLKEGDKKIAISSYNSAKMAIKQYEKWIRKKIK